MYMYKAGHPGVPVYVCLSGLYTCIYGWVGRLLHLSFLSDFLKLACYAHVFPCMKKLNHPLCRALFSQYNYMTLYMYTATTSTRTCVPPEAAHFFTSFKNSQYNYMYMHPRQLNFSRRSDCLGCAVLLCLVCLFDLACFFLSFFLLVSHLKTCTQQQPLHVHTCGFLGLVAEPGWTLTLQDVEELAQSPEAERGQRLPQVLDDGEHATHSQTHHLMK